MVRALVIMALAAALSSACAHERQATVAPASPAAAIDPVMQAAVEAALNDSRYRVVERNPGRVRAYILGHRRWALVDVVVGPNGADIHWLEGEVGPYYEKWARALTADIQRHAAALAATGQPAPATPWPLPPPPP